MTNPLILLMMVPAGVAIGVTMIVHYERTNPNSYRNIEIMNRKACKDMGGVYHAPRYKPAVCLTKDAVLWHEQRCPGRRR